ncbi:MAG: hypothetical protein ACE5J5_01915 [Candidatus Hydrothermarchaeales archaeon]
MKGNNLVLIFVLFITVFALSLPVRGSEASRESSAAEHSEAVEAKEEHATAEEHGVAAEHEEPWWRFPGWEAVFAVLACIYLLLAIRWLPIFLEDKSAGGGH